MDLKVEFHQFAKEVLVRVFPIPDDARVDVKFEVNVVKIKGVGGKDGMTIQLPGKARPEGCFFEVTERYPRQLSLTLEKEIPNVDWPLESEKIVAPPKKVSSVPSVAASMPPGPSPFELALEVYRRSTWFLYENVFLRFPFLRQNWFDLMLGVLFTLFVTSWVNMAVTGGTRSFSVAIWLFQKCFGILSMLAWLSVWRQIEGLVGERGIVPLTDTLKEPSRAFSLFRLGVVPATNESLRLHCYVGAACSALFFLNIFPSAAIAISTVFYLSIRNVGSVFFQLQFDALLIEMGWSCVLMYLVPVHWISYSFSAGQGSLATRTAMVVSWWTLLRLLFCSGIVKLTSRDATWADCTALSYHYWSQPLPTWVGYYAHRYLSDSVHRVSCFLHFVFELLGPLCFFIGPFRVVFGFVSAFGLQVGIALTGNYGFFNACTAALSLLLVDDSWFPQSLVVYVAGPSTTSSGLVLSAVGLLWTPVISVLAIAFFVTIVLCSLSPMAGMGLHSVAPSASLQSIIHGRFSQLPSSIIGGAKAALTKAQLNSSWLDELSLHACYVHSARFSLVNSYGLFRVMTTSRKEVVISASGDARTWQPYELPYKPGTVLSVPPPFVALFHLPRLDWRLWFCQFRPQPERWVYQLQKRLLEGESDVLTLMRVVPVQKPKFVKMDLVDYKFADLEEHRRTGNYWKTQPPKPFLATQSIGNFVLPAEEK